VKQTVGHHVTNGDPTLTRCDGASWLGRAARAERALDLHRSHVGEAECRDVDK